MVLGYPLIIKHGNGKSLMNGGFWLGKSVIYMVHSLASHVCLADSNQNSKRLMFAAMVHHQLRIVLSCIQGFLARKVASYGGFQWSEASQMIQIE